MQYEMINDDASNFGDLDWDIFLYCMRACNYKCCYLLYFCYALFLVLIACTVLSPLSMHLGLHTFSSKYIYIYIEKENKYDDHLEKGLKTFTDRADKQSLIRKVVNQGMCIDQEDCKSRDVHQEQDIRIHNKPPHRFEHATSKNFFPYHISFYHLIYAWDNCL